MADIAYDWSLIPNKKPTVPHAYCPVNKYQITILMLSYLQK
jgi:hypothetical protein